MKKYLSPGNLIVTTGGILAFIGMTAYFTDSVNLSVPTFFYGVPIFLIGFGQTRYQCDQTSSLYKYIKKLIFPHYDVIGESPKMSENFFGQFLVAGATREMLMSVR